MSLTEKLNRLISEVRAAKATTKKTTAKKTPVKKPAVRKKANPKNDVSDILIVGKKLSAAIKSWRKSPNKKTQLAMTFEFDDFESVLEYTELVEGSAIESAVLAMVRRLNEEGDFYADVSPNFVKELDKFLTELPRIKAKSK